MIFPSLKTKLEFEVVFFVHPKKPVRILLKGYSFGGKISDPNSPKLAAVTLATVAPCASRRGGRDHGDHGCVAWLWASDPSVVIQQDFVRILGLPEDK